jgi:hypothetical protein
MQHGTTPLPLPLQASGLASSEVSTISSEPVPVLVPLLTLEQERERERAHQTRRQKTTHDIAKPLGATVLSLLPRSVLEANFVTKTHQKGVEFQLAVENSLSNDTLEPLIESGIAEKLEPKTINENSSAIFHHANSRETEDTKMAALPYREEESDWAKDFKTQMTSDCQFEHPIDFWEYKAALKAMELAQDEGSKVMTLTGSYFDLKDLKKKHLKAFAAKFYEVLPDHEFKFEESAI